MKTTPKERQALFRARRRKAGLVEFRAWVTKEQREKLRKYLEELKR